MKTLLILGCSYSHLGYHKQYSKKENSYTIHLMKKLGANKLINLAMSGASPSTVNRILLQYLDNPVFGYPDFVFIQWPNASRNEYFIDEKYDHDDSEYITTSINQGLIHFETGPNEGLPELTIGNNTWTSTQWDGTITMPRGDDKRFRSAHETLFINESQRLINLYKEVGIAENYLGNLRIPYAYVESDYFDGQGILSQDHYDMPAYNYAQHLCHKQYFIPGMGIQKNSPTYAGANDDYADGHPGPQSHKNFADVLIPKLKEIINS